MQKRRRKLDGKIWSPEALEKRVCQLENNSSKTTWTKLNSSWRMCCPNRPKSEDNNLMSQVRIHLMQWNLSGQQLNQEIFQNTKICVSENRSPKKSAFEKPADGKFDRRGTLLWRKTRSKELRNLSSLTFRSLHVKNPPRLFVNNRGTHHFKKKLPPAFGWYLQVRWILLVFPSFADLHSKSARVSISTYYWPTFPNLRLEAWIHVWKEIEWSKLMDATR